MDVETIVPGHGPIGGKNELAEVREYFLILKREARKRFDAGMSPGKAAADIKMGKFDNWIGAERNLLNTFRLYNEFDGTLTPIWDLDRLRRAIEEYNSIPKARG
jgi:cyclase